MSPSIISTVPSSAMIPLASIILLIAFIVRLLITNLILSPLSSIPGPKLYALKSLPINFARVRGKQHPLIERLHAQYGSTVRIGPNEISCFDGAAWPLIFGHAKAGEPENVKANVTPRPNGTYGLLSSNGEQHKRQRRTLNYAFSAAGLREQESKVLKHVDLLVEGLKALCARGSTGSGVDDEGWVNVDISACFNWVAFVSIRALPTPPPVHSTELSNKTTSANNP